jgi:hypothetical protein
VRIESFSFLSGRIHVAFEKELYASVLAALINSQEARLRKPDLSSGTHLLREFLAEGWSRIGSRKGLLFLKQKEVCVHVCLSHLQALRALSEFRSVPCRAGILVVLNRGDYLLTRQRLANLPRAAAIPIWLIHLK